MADRILALGISGLPNPIKCISWEEIDNGLNVNISDYNVVFIDFSYFTVNNDKTNLIRKCLNTNKFVEVVEAGIDLYILGTTDIFYKNNFYNIYSWLPNIIEVRTVDENGEIVNCLNKSFVGYFNLLKNWSFYFKVNQTVSEEYPYLYDVKDVAINNVNKKVGFEISNFRKIRFDIYMTCLKYGERYERAVEDKHEGKLYFLHTLGDNTTNGVLSLLKEIYNLSFSRSKPEWNDTIQTKKSSLITEQMKKLFGDKQQIESEISEKFGEIEKIEYFKQLIWQVGAELEDVVHESLKLMGLLPSSPTKADDDGIFECQEKEYMLEIKSGLERGAKFSELSKLITRIENRKNIHKTDCKGIFIMNHYANYPPEERDNPFPKNVIDTANVNSVKLITTEELFEIIKPILDGEISPEEAQKQFMN